MTLNNGCALPLSAQSSDMVHDTKLMLSCTTTNRAHTWLHDTQQSSCSATCCSELTLSYRTLNKAHTWLHDSQQMVAFGCTALKQAGQALHTRQAEGFGCRSLRRALVRSNRDTNPASSARAISFCRAATAMAVMDAEWWLHCSMHWKPAGC